MPQIGWSEILVIILVAILVIGPKDLPVVLRKFIQIKNGIKNYVNSFQKGIDDIVQEQEKDIKKIIDINPEEKNKKKPENCFGDNGGALEIDCPSLQFTITFNWWEKGTRELEPAQNNGFISPAVREPTMQKSPSMQ